MSSNQVKGQGCSIAYLNTAVSPNAYVTVAELMGGNAPTPNNPPLDSTDQSETAKSYIASGVTDNGQVTWNIGYRPNTTTHEFLMASCEAGTALTWRISYSGSPVATETFPGYIVSVGREIPKEALVTGSFTVQVTGAVTRA